MTAPIVERLREAAATLPEERVSMQTLALLVTAGLMLAAWTWGSEWVVRWLSI